MTPKPSACANSRPPSTNFSFRRRAEPPRYRFIPTAGSGSRRSTTSEAGLRSTGRNSTATGWFRSPLRRTIRSAAWPSCASCSTGAHGPTRSASSSTAWFRRSNVRLPTRRSAAASRPSPSSRSTPTSRSGTSLSRLPTSVRPETGFAACSPSRACWSSTRNPTRAKTSARRSST